MESYTGAAKLKQCKSPNGEQYFVTMDVCDKSITLSCVTTAEDKEFR